MEALYSFSAERVWVCVLVIDLSGFLCWSISLSIKTLSNIHPPPLPCTPSIHPSKLPSHPPSPNTHTHYPSICDMLLQVFCSHPAFCC